MLTNKTVVLGITGSIAAYKAVDLASKLTQAGANVEVIMTESATKFIAPLTLRSLTGRQVITSMWELPAEPRISHIALARKADVVVIGGGGAGLPAALTAVEEGAKSVIVLEKRFTTGGDALRANWIFAIESHLQKEAGVDISRDDIYRKALEWHRYDRVNPRILRAFINKTADTIRWLEEKGIEFELRGTTSHWTKGTGGLCTFSRVYISLPGNARMLKCNSFFVPVARK